MTIRAPLAALLLAAPAARLAEPAPPTDSAAATAALNQPCRLSGDLSGRTVRQLVDDLSREHKLAIRFDEPAFRQARGGEDVFEVGVITRSAAGLTVRQLLELILSGLNHGGHPLGEHQRSGPPFGVKVRGGEVQIALAYLPPGVHLAVRDRKDWEATDADHNDEFYGPAVSVFANEKPLAEVVAELRERTGANIAVDPRVRDKLSAKVTLTLNDARLMTALRVGGAMAGVAVAPIDNVFYVTDEPTAAKLLAKGSGMSPGRGGWSRTRGAAWHTPTPTRRSRRAGRSARSEGEPWEPPRHRPDSEPPVGRTA